MSEVETMELLEGLQLKILNNTGDDLVLQAQKIEKGKYKKGRQAPAKSNLMSKRTLSSLHVREAAKVEQILRDGSSTG